jgi:hypothetical protein
MPTIHAKAYPLDVTPDADQFTEDERRDIVRILDIFLFDANQHVHLCELAPSCFMQFLYNVIEFRDDLDDDDRKHELGEKWGTLHDDTYMSVSDLERAAGVVDCGEFPYATQEEIDASEWQIDGREEAWEEAIDSCHANRPI